MNYYISAIQKEIEQIQDIINKSPPLYVLETFYNGEDECIKKMKLADNDFMLDSGAFTFMNSKKDVTKNEMEDYLKRYIKFIKDNDINNFVEMDLDIIFGYEQVKDWRNQIIKETNKQPIPVWHKSRGIDDYKKCLKEYEYLAIGGFAIKELKQKEYPLIKKMVKHAKKRGNHVHGLGYSRVDTPTWDFYSVDSASWQLKASRFQASIEFKNGRLYCNDERNEKYKLNRLKMIQNNFNEILKYQYFLKNIK